MDESLSVRLAELWGASEGPDKDVARLGFFSLVNSRLRKDIRGLLRKRFDRISDADLEDCYSEGVESFLQRHEAGGLDGVKNPAGYIWACALNAARSLCERQDRRGEVPLSTEMPAGIGRDDGCEVLPSGPSRGRRLSEREQQAWVTEVVESLVDDVVVEKTWSERLIAATTARLTPRLRRVVEHMLVFGPDYSASEAPSDLGMNPSTYRVAKKRAFEKLRVLIPVVMDELGIAPQRAAAEEVLRARVEFPSDSENGVDETPQGLES